MITKVLDASALLAFLEKEKGYEKVKKAMTDALKRSVNLLMSVVNWGEVYYILIRHYGAEKADQVAMLIETLPIDLVPADRAITEHAARYKALQKLPYADSFAAALAKTHRAELLTGDQEFHAVERDISIVWL